MKVQPPRLEPVRLGLVYAGLYGSTGVSAPYMALYLRHLGLTGAQIGAILAAPLLARLFTGPLIAHVADGFRQRRTAVVILALASGAAFAILFWAPGPVSAGLVWFVGATLIAACSPLVDVIVLQRAAARGFSYATARSVGSAAFIVANLVGGVLVTRAGARAVVAWIIGASVVSALVAALVLPSTPVHDGAAPARRGRASLAASLRLLSPGPFLLVIVAGGLIQASHAFYYSFSTLLWRRQGIDAETVGALWATGVAAEVAFFVFGDRVRRRLGPENLLILGGTGAALRWAAFAFRPPPAALFALQVLHALSFAATFMGALALAARLSAPAEATLAQSLNAALSSGVLIGLATLASGPLYDAAGVGGYAVMTLVALAGVACALAHHFVNTAPRLQRSSS